MEILAPAGSMAQALAAINGGCDALYGGLKAWNARKRAASFTLEEYKILLELCHQKNIKFYMTLNILMTTKEIDDLKELFQSTDFPKPDAVIVADLGVVKMFKDYFPEIPLHASTQFGAYNLDDIKLLEEMGFARVILAREVSLSELKALKDATSMELEVFIYGSQCIAFSGQCLWGGLLNKTSGNRGGCIGMCRDIYSCNGVNGQVMYPQDIDCISLMEELDALGIASIKIEGRLRKPEDIHRIVKNYSSVKRCKHVQNRANYIGYFSDELPVKDMLNTVNPRNKYNTETEHMRFDYVSLNEVLTSMSAKCKKVSYETNVAEDCKKLVDIGAESIVFAVSKYDELLKILELDTKHTQIIYKLPILDFNNSLDRMLPLLKGKDVIISRLGQIAVARRMGLNIVGGEYTLNICNSYAKEFLRQFGVEAYTYHPENFNFYSSDKNMEVIILGRIPLGFSRACWGEVGCCNKRCGSDSFMLHNETKNYDLEILCDNEFGYRTILNKESFGAVLLRPLDKARIVLTGLDKDIKDIIIIKKECNEKTISLGGFVYEN